MPTPQTPKTEWLYVKLQKNVRLKCVPSPLWTLDMEVTSHSPDMVYKLRPLTDIKVIAVVDQRGSVYWTSSRVCNESNPVWF